MSGIILGSKSSLTSVDAKKNETKNNVKLKDDDNVFAMSARNAGMDKLANFLSDDWSANVARKAGFENFAKWLDNKSDTGEELNDDGFFSNIAREAIKHPIVTLATITTTVFLGKKMVNYVDKIKPKKNLVSTPKTVTGVNSVMTTTPMQLPSKMSVDAMPKQLLSDSQLIKIIDEGLEYEQKINFSNLEIFKDVSPEARQRIINHFAYPLDQERFLSFATGATPGLLEKNYLDDIFDVLRGDSIKVIETFDKKVGTLVLNSDAAKKIIKSNRSLFVQRLGLPEASSVDEIFTIISKSSTSPLANANKFSDLRLLLTGCLEKNSIISQIVQDITIAEKHSRVNVGYVSFYTKSARGVESFKQALIDNLNSSKSSYASMPQSFKDEVVKIINSISVEEYSRRLGNPTKVFQDGTYKLQKSESLRKMATKLEHARQTGASISMS